MELKTDIEFLQRIAKEAEHLVDELKDYVFRQGIDEGLRTEVTEFEAKGLTRLISGKLEGVTINGNEDILDDIITIYENAIKAIEAELEKNAQLEDGHLDKFNQATIDSFNNVKKVLTTSKGKTAEPLKVALDELVEQKTSGRIDEDYREIRVEEIETEEKSINAMMDENTAGLNKFELDTKTEREALDATLKLSKEFFDVRKELEEIKKELTNPDLTDESKAELESEKAEKEKKLAEIFKKFDEKYEKDDEYKQKDNESDFDYLRRMEDKEGKSLDFQVRYIVRIKQADLKTKIEALKGDKVKVYNEKTQQFEDINIEDYVDVTKTAELNNLSRKIISDRLANRDALKSQRTRLEELNKQKDNYTAKRNNTVSSNGNLPVQVSEEIGFWEKFSKRREYHKNNGEGRLKAIFKSFFTKSDPEVFAEEVKKTRIPSDFRKSILVKLENAVKSGKTKDEAVRDTKVDIIEDMRKDDPYVK